MHVARKPAALLERRGCDDARPVRGDLARRPDQQSEVEAETEHVARVDPGRIERRMEEVVDAARPREDARDREPATQLVVSEAVAAREAKRREEVQKRQAELPCAD